VERLLSTPKPELRRDVAHYPVGGGEAVNALMQRVALALESTRSGFNATR
jgi:hypothetical protein